MRLACWLLLSGCTPITAGVQAPISPIDRYGTYKNAVEYEVAETRVKGDACASVSVTDSEYKRTKDPTPTVNRYIFEKAKMAALDNAKDADGLIEIRSYYIAGPDGNECVTVSGRPYRIKAMRAAPPPEAETPMPSGIMKPSM